MLIDGYNMEILTPPCEPGAERYFAKAHLAVDISEVLPYLNGTLADADYMPSAKALTWEQDGHKIALHASEINVNNIESRDWAKQAIDDLVDLVNRTWEGRDEITPSFDTVRRVTPMAVYQLLPQTNCGECGESTCFNYAVKLAASQTTLQACSPVYQPEYAGSLAELEALVAAAGLGDA